VLAAAVVAAPARAAAPLCDAPPVWYDDDRRDVPPPRVREPNLVWNGPLETFVRPLGRITHPGRLVRRVGTVFGGDHVPAAANVNALDEVPNSSWFTNRIGLFDMTPDDAARGAGDGAGPDRSGPWTVVRAKTEGVTPGFTIRDARGGVFLVKFDPVGFARTSTAAGAISARIFHAAGYNVPDDGVVTFRREDLVLGDDVKLTLPDGSKRAMTAGDIDAILASVESAGPGEWRAIASRLLPGKPVGPFDYKGRRRDDPNDRVNHEDRRELRGLRLFAAWLCHFDTKQQNSLDMYVEEGGRRFVRHHLIDFASTLGAGANSPNPTYGYEYSVDLPAIGGRALALGLHEDAWRRLRRPEGLPEVGYFESAFFDPGEFKPQVPNAAFANLTDRDGYWAAKVISAFRDEHLAAIVAKGEYADPAAAAHVARTLAERRDAIARHWFDRVAPLDFFVAEGAVLSFRDLGAERGLYPGTAPRYRARVAAVGAGRGAAARGAWTESGAPSARLDDDATATMLRTTPEERAPFLAVECQVDRGAGWSRSVTAYVARASGRVVAVER
jgi:hypothetical protein